jgi:hypothetical protein
LAQATALRGSRFSWVVLLLLLVWGALGFWFLRPAHAVMDLQGWRQADTETIAENLTAPGSSLFLPAVAWGDRPGYVETELQLYTASAALLMRLFGRGEWAGQLVSTLAMLAVGAIVFFDLRRRRSVFAAACGLAALLSSRSIAHLTTSIQPDAFSLAGYAAAWAFFLRYRDHEKARDLVGFSAALAVAMLVKPTAAQLGLSSALLLLLSAPRLLKRPGVWLAWLFALALLGLYLWNAHQVYVHYGNSFGIFKGGNDKVPTLHELFAAGPVFQAVRRLFVWGVGIPGTVALIVLAVRRKVTAECWALLFGNVILTVATIRITASLAGTHYLAPAAILSAEAVSQVTVDLLAWAEGRGFPRWAELALGLALGVSVIRMAQFRRVMFLADGLAPIVYGTGLALTKIAHPGDSIVVRAKLYDPRVFYVSHLTGWQLNHLVDDPTPIPSYVKRGAKYFVDPIPEEKSSTVVDWLRGHARLVHPATVSSPPEASPPGATGAIWELLPEAPSPPAPARTHAS